MRKVGIVCEYNPFHLGHLYQIGETKRLLGEDAAIVCAMSGDFVQRGEAAVFDKFARAEAACRSGADLVIELPLPWCLSSAEGFAFCAVSILHALGCDTLSFGSESAELGALTALADFFLSDGASVQIRARINRDETLSFARARQLAAAEALGGRARLLSNPNDILAVEYLKAIRRLGADIQSLPIQREGAGHDNRGEEGFRSAMQLREMIGAGEDPAPFIPQTAMEVYRRETEAGRVRNERLLETAILSRLYLLKEEDFDRLPDAGGGAGRRLYDAVSTESGLQRIVQKACSKRYTAARMRRMLLCAAFGICAEDTRGEPPYIRILAANARGRACLASMRGETAVPIINRAAEVRKYGPRAESIFSRGAEAHTLYQLQFVTIDDRKPDRDWKKGAAIV